MTDCTCAEVPQRAEAVEALNRLMEGGVRPRDWDSLSVGRLESVADGCPASAEANLLLYYRFLDAGQPALAAAHLNRLLDVGDRLPPPLQTELALTAAYFAARHAGDAEAARGWLQQTPAEAANPALRAQAEAAVLLAEGRCSAAREVAETGLMSLHDGLLGGLSSVQADALRELVEQADAAMPAPPPPAPLPPKPAVQPAAFARPNRGAAARRAVSDSFAAGPTLGLGVAIALVGLVTLVIAVMPLPGGGSLRVTGQPIAPSFSNSDGSSLMHAVCPNGCPGQSSR